MASSSNVPLPILYGQNFQIWSRKMEEYLVEEGLWYVIEEGFERPTGLFNDEDVRSYKENKVNDKLTLSLLHKALSPIVVSKFHSKKTAKATWDSLQQMYNKSSNPPPTSESGPSKYRRRTEENDKFPNERKFNESRTVLRGGKSTQFKGALAEKVNGKRKVSDLLFATEIENSSYPLSSSESEQSSEPMERTEEKEKFPNNRKMNKSARPSKSKHVHFESDSEREDSLSSRGGPPASGNMRKPQRPWNLCYEFALMGSAVGPAYKLHLPTKLTVSSTVETAIVRSTRLKREYKMPFNGENRQFGVSMWKKFVKDHQLDKGHRLKFDIVKRDKTSFELEIST